MNWKSIAFTLSIVYTLWSDAPRQFLRDVRAGRFHVVSEKLTLHGINVNTRGPCGQTPLMLVMAPLEWCVDYRDDYISMFYLLAAQDGVAWDATDDLGNSMVHYAMRITNEQVIRYICDRAPAEFFYHRNNAGKTPDEVAQALGNRVALVIWKEYKIYHDVYLCMKYRRIYWRS